MTRHRPVVLNPFCPFQNYSSTCKNKGINLKETLTNIYFSLSAVYILFSQCSIIIK